MSKSLLLLSCLLRILLLQAPQRVHAGPVALDVSNYKVFVLDNAAQHPVMGSVDEKLQEHTLLRALSKLVHVSDKELLVKPKALASTMAACDICIVTGHGEMNLLGVPSPHLNRNSDGKEDEPLQDTQKELNFDFATHLLKVSHALAQTRKSKIYFMNLCNGDPKIPFEEKVPGDVKLHDVTAKRLALKTFGTDCDGQGLEVYSVQPGQLVTYDTAATEFLEFVKLVQTKSTGTEKQLRSSIADFIQKVNSKVGRLADAKDIDEEGWGPAGPADQELGQGLHVFLCTKIVYDREKLRTRVQKRFDKKCRYRGEDQVAALQPLAASDGKSLNSKPLDSSASPDSKTQKQHGKPDVQAVTAAAVASTVTGSPKASVVQSHQPLPPNGKGTDLKASQPQPPTNQPDPQQSDPKNPDAKLDVKTQSRKNAQEATVSKPILRYKLLNDPFYIIWHKMEGAGSDEVTGLRDFFC